MIMLPLFGKDSSTQISSMVISLIATSVFWVVLFICFIFINPRPKTTAQERFKTVQIVLSDHKIEQVEKIPQVEEKLIDSTTSQDTAPSPSVVETAPIVTEVPAPSPQVVEKTPVSKKTETKKPDPVASKVETPVVQQPVQTTPVPSAPESTTPAVTTPKPSRQQQPFDWSMFDDDSAPSSQTTTPQKVVTSQSGVTGSAGTTSTGNQTTTQSSSSTVTNRDTTASSSTTNSLASIADAKGETPSSSGAVSTPSKTVSTDNGSIKLEFGEGGKRTATTALSIYLSDAAKKLIDQSIKIPIKITIEMDGSILRSNIIIPSSIVNSTVRAEIINAISRWHFDVADTTTTATFNFNIVVQ